MEIQQARTKIQRYCARKEHCEYEIRGKLISYELQNNEIELILEELRDLNFWNEERYAQAFVHDKQMFHSWGPMKIAYALKRKHVPSAIIDMAMRRIEYKTYYRTLSSLLQKKYQVTTYKDNNDARKKLSRYAQNKGYPYDMINEVLDDILL